MAPPVLSHVANHKIPYERIFLVNEENPNLFEELEISEALERAQGEGMDLVLLSAEQDSSGVVRPLVKIMDLGRFKYDNKKREREIKEKQAQVDNHEIRITPTIATNDLKTKAKKAREFLLKGDTVKVTLRYRGREVTKKSMGLEMLETFFQKLEDVARKLKEPKFTTPRLVHMFLIRDKKKYEAYMRAKNNTSSKLLTTNSSEANNV